MITRSRVALFTLVLAAASTFALKDEIGDRVYAYHFCKGNGGVESITYSESTREVRCTSGDGTRTLR